RNSSETQLFPKRDLVQELPLSGITPENQVLALIAHDQMNLEMCCFVVAHARQLFNEFDYILATDVTGEWVKKFALAAGRSDEEISKVRCCLSGSYGGYIQIAAAVVKKLCRKVIFLQDPFTSHAHETDIRLFEQAVLLFERAAVHGVEIELATNIASAKAILGYRELS
ncbi:MAG TPA: hypothetical protein VFQ23_20480, partial [Anaerolineales bacterium]|nr:hypothetical protein [Anaerolineales bacterium]